MADFYGFDWEEVMKKSKEMQELYPPSTRIVVEHVSGYIPDQRSDAKPRVIQNGDRGWVTSVDPFANVHVLFDGGHSEFVHPLFDSFRKLTEKEKLEDRKEWKIEGFAAGQVFYDKENGPFFTLLEKSGEDTWVVQDLDFYGQSVGVRSVSAEALALGVLNGRVSSFGEIDLNNPEDWCEFMEDLFWETGTEDEYGAYRWFRRGLDERLEDAREQVGRKAHFDSLLEIEVEKE